MEVKTGAETDEYRYFDPKLMRANERLYLNRTLSNFMRGLI